VCSIAFMATAGALKKTCGAACERAVINFRSDRKRYAKLGEHWPRWKKEMWLRLHPEHVDHATYCNQAADASANGSA
jgi:hypothetical protein